MVSFPPWKIKISHSSQADTSSMRFPQLLANCIHKKDTEYATRKEPAGTPASTALPAPLSPDFALVSAFSYITPKRHSGHNTFGEASCCISIYLREFFL
ncbi:hypothetical protein PoB_001905300 [Plakobranchus ocellatus]|uniref:Uncharacterized protein n=1 Tax=Plakobranchus ocellatus TaxID=259542 RepID=A0AAV3ZD95_9GAST|nr:hypothetical protein PoB_001905300 [Plakobranchus ocellatus]